jgi:hypothetical protein
MTLASGVVCYSFAVKDFHLLLVQFAGTIVHKFPFFEFSPLSELHSDYDLRSTSRALHSCRLRDQSLGVEHSPSARV